MRVRVVQVRVCVVQNGRGHVSNEAHTLSGYR